MKKIAVSILSIIIFLIGCNASQGSKDPNIKIATQYLKEKGYNVIEVNGKDYEYILDKEKLTTQPYSSFWLIQTTDADQFIDKKIEVYKFIINNNPLDNVEGNSKKQTIAYIMLSDGKVCGSHAYPDYDEVRVGNAIYSLDGKTPEEVTGMNYPDYMDQWLKKYK